ncbi:MAG TPA: WYL domain-containing protein [Myxococcota bacterium]|nr:WYL domain-containing protein [Myxococcota bacterium]
MRGDQLSRQWQLIQLLLQRRAGMSAAEIAAELNWSVRNIYRDLQALQQAGFPLFNERAGRKVRWAFIEGFRHATSIPFTADELMAIEAARRMMRPLAGTVLAESLEAAMAKIRAQLPEQVCRYLEKYRGSFADVGGPLHDYGRIQAIVHVLKEAITSQESVELTYKAFSTGDSKRRVVDPYGLFHHDGTLYMVGHCHLRKALRNFALDRVRMPSPTGKKFERPDDFDLESYMADAFGAYLGPAEEVILQFEADAARYIKESVWHPSQELRVLEDGGCLLELRVPVSDEIARWILGWTPSCEVLKPAALREKVARMLEEGATNYRNEETAARSKAASGKLAEQNIKRRQGRAKKKASKKAPRSKASQGRLSKKKV